MNAGLNKIFWLWIPLMIVAAQALIELFAPQGLLGELHSESGPHEFIEFLFLLMAFFVALRIFPLLKNHPKWLYGWVGLAALCCFYVAGEEVSWGQHFLKWSTPEYWAHLNDQGETNLHNTSSWLDQKPRLILLLGVGIGGLVFPALQKFKPGFLPQQFAIIYPPAILGVTAALAISANLVDKIFEAMVDAPLLSRGSEVEELYLFYFVLLYLVVLRRRLMQSGK
ncbi:MAG: hypothetical protein R3E13_11910 [Alphaproteobacteria bacterium]